MAEYFGASFQIMQTPLSQETAYTQPVFRPQAKGPNQIMMIILPVVLVIMLVSSLGVSHLFKKQDQATTVQTTVQTEEVAEPVGNSDTAVSDTAVAMVEGGISPIFSPQVQHWAPQIVAWAAQFGLDPDIVATIMQIESCGDPQAVSHAGAQGLFQVMPFHFTAGEVMLDPNTNAARGLAYYAERLQQTGGDVFQAFAGYNGGHVAAAGNWNTWANETQRYYTWSKGIYEDAKSGAATSTTLQQWMQAGGASLCQQASNRLNLN